MTPADRAALDELTAALRDGTDELDRRLAAVMSYITEPPGGGRAQSRANASRAAYDSGRPGTSPDFRPAA